MEDRVWFVFGALIALTLAAKIVGKCFKVCLMALMIAFVVGVVTTLTSCAAVITNDAGSVITQISNNVSKSF